MPLKESATDARALWVGKPRTQHRFPHHPSYWRALRPASKSGAVMILASARADHYRPVRTFIASGTTYADCMADVVAQLAEGEELVSVEALLDE